MLSPLMLAGGMPVFLSVGEVVVGADLLNQSEALGDWQSAATLRALLGGAGPSVSLRAPEKQSLVRNIFRFADGTRMRMVAKDGDEDRAIVPHQPLSITVVDSSMVHASPFDLIRVLEARGFNPVGVMMEMQRVPRRVSPHDQAQLHRQMEEAAKRAGLLLEQTPFPGVIESFTTALTVVPPPALLSDQTKSLARSTALSRGVVLEWKSLPALLSNEKIVDMSHSWPRPTVERNDLSLQDLFEFYQLVFALGFQFRGYMALIEIRNGNISRLKLFASAISQSLAGGLESLLQGDANRAKFFFSKADEAVGDFTVIMREIARETGLDINLFGIISLLGD
ncbi:MAG: hypothetical protein Q7T03_06200 [Deltaproteobacteria bacterium]|nr:hypothetical protein [Deltaproteobacteria bacterium]